MRTVEASIRMKAPADTILRAFLEIEPLKNWWGVDRCLIEPHPGGVWACAWERSDAGYKYSGTGIISRYDEGRSLRIGKMVYFNPDHPILGPLNLTITVAQIGDQTEVSVLQDGYGRGSDWDWYYEAVVDGWPASLKLLKTWLESSK